MAHSNRIRIHWSLIVIEVIVFMCAIGSAYLSQVNAWSGFLGLSIGATILFSILKIFDASPALTELLIREDKASKMALAAERYGVREYFNMQSAQDQACRNQCTQTEIERAQSLWLCANSGASFLDPAVYRHWQFVEKRLKAGVEFRVVLLDPYSQEKAFRNKINVNGENFDSKINVANLIKLHNSYPSLEIRFAKSGMHATVFASENVLFFDPYQVGVVNERIENRSFSMLIEHASPDEGVGLYQLFKSHFNTLWTSSTAFAEWLASVEDRLPSGLPVLKAR